MDGPEPPPFLALPAELIHHVLSFLAPSQLLRVSQVCRLLYEHSRADQLWLPFVQANVPGHTLRTPAPSSSWRELYVAFHPYWFLSKHKIWFSDSANTGHLIVARYDPRIGAIEAYALSAERRKPTIAHWESYPEAIIHTFSPLIRLNLDLPTLHIDASSIAQAIGDGPRLSKEVPMDIYGGSNASAAIFSRLILSRKLPPAAITPMTQVWPPHILPASERTRNDSGNQYMSLGHRPSKLSEISENTFRLRQWMEFSSRPHGMSLRVAEEVRTFATLPAEVYTPTKEKPWQGIWCGDYAGHGCEFLVVMQPDDPAPLPEAAERTLSAMRTPSVSSGGSWVTAPMSSDMDATEGGESSQPDPAPEDVPEKQDEKLEAEDEHLYHGRIEAIKLTGDPNIPRGEYTFIAPDIGRDGFIQSARDDMFKGARIVRSVGHIAARGFRDDDFIASQLILISHDRMAQYWETFGHVSFYERVDVDQLIKIP
ncbi:uncharacterized protein BDZ99DRAFT_187383 [Mytilinidion resinicola]|uniref:F-box domain-containing protein n=1 Tax=Mytilinidion resinicola TaxID=574789 RepID=A0A6A6Z1E5_9PEZI|nr:uncharacterized protein BDZ99DRAFT_187383 [Mytilinidion resinicola]KAF2814931.1 hypothetical protein BDZ99DRAFT_187383 [Mytilinidion resinicola]